ncbi:beta-ketoacyl-ACP synthase II [Microbispora corallina]|uniref:Beta-ketoacyl-[acyl-carrier-protein] synthase II n=1 Tax=Microbispora corallina TaxID=83302 RepID=A0ABQ4FQF2_9ACTN|nr:beta-ketoacyl synthase N-terminal-like domain-containing protein [Microbispora corallina]GIH37043.1 beta-ketoacyl-[acyl-carrier-protein] synthase II [Microbispora corallina]
MTAGAAVAAPVRPLLVTGCGVVSPAGVGLAPLAGALESGPAAPGAPEDSPDGYPPQPLWALPELPVAEHLGTKGLRHVDRFTLMALIACRSALRQAGAEGDGADIGVVVATSTGSLRTLSEVACDTVLQEKPYMVNPGNFPNVVMNACGGQIAIKNGLRAVNSTISGGQVSSLAAVRFARTAIEGGRASRVLVGGVEELVPISAWGWHLSQALDAEAPIGEGTAMFLLEDAEAAREAGRTGLAEVLACEVGYHGVDDADGRARGLAACVGRALSRSGVLPDEVDVVSVGAAGHRDMEAVEERALRAALGRDVPLIRAATAVGECYSASGALQLAALLASWQEAPDGDPRTGLVTSVGDDGNVGCLVVRRWL